MDELIAALAKALAPELAKHLRSQPDDLVCQDGSALGRSHCRIVRERMARGEPGAYIGARRRHFLTRDAYAEELARHGKGKGLHKVISAAIDGDDIETRIHRKLARAAR